MKSLLKQAGIMITILLVFLLPDTFGQHQDAFAERGERYFRFTIGSQKDFKQVAGLISIDQRRGDTVIANASYEEFQKILALGLPFEFLPHPSDLIEDEALDYHDIPEIRSWNYYPTYDAYVQMMNDFEADHPLLCEIQNIGTLPSGRQLLVAKITSPTPSTVPKPKFLYTATMHGDELAGYVLSLRLIDYLLENYGTDAFVTRLVDSIEIWINPLANPDGTYHAGNHTISGAKRRNANNVDLNRNFPDPVAGPNPDGNAWQPETIHFMNHAELHKFNLSSNWHGGAEVCNYPWDTWAHLTADNAWWVYTMREYADTVHAYSPSPYMRGYNNGITNGYAWYRITGGRQDYMNYFQQCREFTLELSNQKIPPASELPVFWEYNYRSFLNYMEQALYGIRGVITNAVSGEPVHAMLSIEGHDADSSYVFSNTLSGGYHRYLKSGSYNLTFTAPCYEPYTISGVAVTDRQTGWLDVELQPLSADVAASDVIIEPAETVHFTAIQCAAIDSLQWFFHGGIPSRSNSPEPSVQYLNEGIFDVMLILFTTETSDTLVLKEYITVASTHLMQNGAINTCLAKFYDSGGPSGNYSNNENYTLTFLPANPGQMIEVIFESFNTEANYDYLYVYDGLDTYASEFSRSPFHGTTIPENLTATNPDGAITFMFTSDESVNRPGWEAGVKSTGTPDVLQLAGFITSAEEICRWAPQTVYTAGDGDHFLTLPSSLLMIVAAENVIMLPGTHFLQGSQVHVFIDDDDYCNPSKLHILASRPSGDINIHEFASNEAAFRIYPNPTSGWFTLEFKDANMLSTVHLEIFNIFGKQIMSAELPGKKHQKLDISYHPPGIYLIRFMMGGETWVEKVLKQ